MKVSQAKKFNPVTIRIDLEVELLDLITALRFTAEKHDKPWVRDSAGIMANTLDAYISDNDILP